MRWLKEDHIFRHPWRAVSTASWLKYPHSKSPHVKNVDVVSRELRDGKLYTRRIITCQNPLPDWMARMLGSKDTVLCEDSVVDPVGKRMILSSRNVTNESVVVAKERCEYFPHPEDHSQTILSHGSSVEISMSGMMKRLTDKAEGVCVEMFSKNASRGRAILDEVCHKVRMEIDHLGEIAHPHHGQHAHASATST